MITDQDIPGLRRLWQDAFGDTDDFLDKFFSVGFSPDRCNCIRQDGKVVAALYWFDCHWLGKKVAYIYAVATDIGYRGRGLCRALMENTHRLLLNQGYGGAVLVPANKGLCDLYAKLGYRGFCPVKRVTAAVKEIPIANKIIPAEYAQLRKSLAGENAILQDGVALNLLATYGEFYKTTTGIYCGYREGNIFHFEEVLGEFPLSETEPLQAMYLSLDGSDDLPNYFSIPLN